MAETFGSTCHGAGRAASRNSSRRTLSYEEARTSPAIQPPGCLPISNTSCHAKPWIDQSKWMLLGIIGGEPLGVRWQIECIRRATCGVLY